MLADAAVVGNLLGKELFAAIEVQTALLRVPISFAAGFSSGITVTLSHLLAKKEKAGSAAAAGILLSCGIGLKITMGVQLLGQRLLDWMAVPAVIHQASLDYLRFYISGTVFSLLFNACIGIFHAYQDAKTPLFLRLPSCCLPSPRSAAAVLPDVLWVTGMQGTGADRGCPPLRGAVCRIADGFLFCFAQTVPCIALPIRIK